MDIYTFEHGTSYEEEFLGFEIYIAPNSDRWLKGVVWSICKDGIEIETDLEFDFDDAICAARSLIQSILK